MTDVEQPRIVVGVDGSPQSERALLWAARHGEATGATVEALAIWHLPVQFGYRMAADEGDLESHAQEWLTGAVAQARGSCPNATITARAERGHPATTLTERTREADLLVLGNKGQGAAAATMLGSVVPQVLHHAACPVVVIP